MNIDSQLIARYVGNEISAEERAIVENKAREDESFAELLKDIEQIWSQSNQLGKKGFVETDAVSYDKLISAVQEKIKEWESEEAFLASYVENESELNDLESFSDKNLLKESSFIWDKSKELSTKPSLEINFDQVFESMNQKIAAQETNKELSNKTNEPKEIAFEPRKVKDNVEKASIWKLQNIAAAVVLLIASMGILFFVQSPTQIEVIAAADIKKVNLPDGTCVWLQEGAKLAYPEEFGDTRDVTLEGIAFFEVAKNPNKAFVIKTDEVYTKVLGTSFLLENTNKAIQIDVHSGKVAFGNEDSQIQLTKDEAASFTNGKVIEKSFVSENVEFIQNALAFDDIPLKQAVEVLNAAYNVEIEVDSKIANQKISGDFSGKELPNIISFINEIYSTTSQEKDGRIYIK